MITAKNSMIAKAIRNQVKCKTIDHAKTDLIKPLSLTKKLNNEIDSLINLAAFSGNLNWNQKYPHLTFENNIRIGINVFTEWFNSKGSAKAINVIPSCSYPDIENLTPDKLWNGNCHYTVESHGLARRCIEGYTRQLNKVGARITTCILQNCYGEYDSFDLEKTKVVGALIRKFSDAKKNKEKTVTCWGDGSPKREFIYCVDAAKLLLGILSSYSNYNIPINISSGQELTIKELAETIADIIGFDGNILWDTTKPNGASQKKLICEDFVKNFEFTPLKTGLKNTIKFYHDMYLNK